MLRYTLRRLTWLPIILFGVSLISFVLLRTLPGQDPVDTIAGQGATPPQKQALRDELGLNRPVFPISFSHDGAVPKMEVHRGSQYSEWITDLVTGNLGREFFSKKPIKDEFARRFFPSFQILAMSLFVSAVVGIGFGIISALYRNSVIDYIVRVFAVLGASVPEFFLLTLMIIIPSYLWNYSMPIGGYKPLWEDPSHNLRLLGPASLVIGIGGAAGLMRLTRTTMLEVLRADYVRTAHSKGLPKITVVLSHAFRNSLTPIVTALGTAFIAILGGSIIAEQILSIDGLGRWFFTAALQRDLTVVQFLVVYTAFLVVLINLIVDLSYAWIDPRVKYS
jgi:peptide/nickel transport system permease protein